MLELVPITLKEANAFVEQHHRHHKPVVGHKFSIAAMAEIILHPCHPDYCKECIYHDDKHAGCLSEDYQKNSYKVNCVWRYCKYKRIRHKESEGESERRGI